MSTRLILTPTQRHSTTGYTLGSALPNFQALEILYHKLQVTVATGACTYLSGSGTYDPIPIGEFIAKVQSNTPLGSYSTLPNPDIVPNAAPSIVVRKACHIVVHVFSDDVDPIYFQSNHPPITTDDYHKGDYRWLVGYSNEEGRCNLISFVVPHPKPASANQNDPFSIFLEYDGGSGTATYPIDPAIKNRGGT